MQRNLVLLAITVGLLLTAAGFAQAQDSTTTQQTTTTTTTATSDNSASTMPDSPQSNDSNVRTVTGCLQKGDSSNEYELTGRDGSTWELKSDAVDLGSHVGHTVTITGAVRNSEMHGMKEDMKKEAQEQGMKKSAAEHGHMTVTNVTMVSHSCS
jgi:hypothetical protein